MKGRMMTEREDGSPCGVVTYLLDWGLVTSEFELQSHYYKTNILRKRMNNFNPGSYGLDRTINILQEARRF